MRRGIAARRYHGQDERIGAAGDVGDMAHTEGLGQFGFEGRVLTAVDILAAPDAASYSSPYLRAIRHPTKTQVVNRGSHLGCH